MKHLPKNSWTCVSATLVFLLGCSINLVAGQSTPSRSFREDPGRMARAAWQPPDEIMDSIGLEEGMIVGEVGSGACGGFTYYLAERVGGTGKVFANDIDERALSTLLDGTARQGFHHVEAVLGLEDDPRFPVESLDVAIMVNMWGFFDYPVRLLNNLISSLKASGRVAIVDSKNRTDAILEAVAASELRVERVETWPERDNIIVLLPKARPLGAGQHL